MLLESQKSRSNVFNILLHFSRHTTSCRRRLHTDPPGVRHKPVQVLRRTFIEKGVIKTVFDHTSLLRSVCEKWNLDPLGARMQAEAGDKRANSFADECGGQVISDTSTSGLSCRFMLEGIG